MSSESRPMPTSDVECVLTKRCRTVAVLARRVLRVSASARRVAAAYGSACEQIFGPSHLISHAFSDGSEAELAVDMARFCVRQIGTLAPLCPTQVLHDPEK